MNRDDLLRRVKSKLLGAFGTRFRHAVLYGSEARGASRPDSDVDLLVLLEGPVDFGRDLQAALSALYPLSLQISRRISAKPVDATEYETVECPLYRTVHQDGVVV